MQGAPPPENWRVPRADWDRPPWNRWSFQHIREILPTVEVHCGESPPWVLPEPSEDIGGIGFEAMDGNQTTFDDMLEATYSDGFIVISRGKVVHESYFNGMTPQTLHLSQSVAKSVASTVAGILIGQGLLDPTAPVTDYLPELEATAWRGAKLQHVLDMTSGVRFDESYVEPTSDIGVTDVASGWKPIPPEADPDFAWPSCIWEQILSLTEQEAEHGSRFLYRSIETDVLAHAMERVSGRRLARLVSEELWSRIGAEESASFTLDPSGYALADGGFNATLRDFARFALVLLNDGAREGTQIVPAAWVADIRRGRHGLFNDDGRELFPNGRYRNMFWIEDDLRETFMALGVFGQLVYVAPEHELVAVKLSSWPEFLSVEHKANTLRALHAVARALA